MDESEEKPFGVERAKQGRANCKKCKTKCAVGELRIFKLGYNPFGGGKLKQWYHVNCIFDQFLSQRVTTARIELPEDVDGLDQLNSEDQEELLKIIEDNNKLFAKKYGDKYIPKKPSTAGITLNKSPVKNDTDTPLQKVNKQSNKKGSKDFTFREFRRLVTDIANTDSYTEKTNVVKKLFTNGSDGTGFKGNIKQWCRLLLPGEIKRIYNLQSKQLIKLFSRIFNTDQKMMTASLNQGDIGETIEEFFTQCKTFKPASTSKLGIQEVDDFLQELSQLTKEEDQLNHFLEISRLCTANDLKVIIRLVKHDLRMNAGAKHILQGVHPDAYEVYQASRSLDVVIERCLGGSSDSTDCSTTIKADINVMIPVKPMLAEACKSVEKAMKKCPNGMYSEIKYDGERVQVHKKGSEFKYFSRSLKPVLPHKVAHFQEYIPKAFPEATDLILDSEILMIDHETGKPLPFGTLGVHKKSLFENANVCLFVFDCMYYNGESLMQKPIDYRKQILKENMTEIPNRIMFSELEIIHQPKQLSSMIAKVLELGLEGLVLKDVKSLYEPGKRHWLKVKKDYLLDGAMADTADLIVLGAWYGTGRKAGLKSVFLMGCYNEATKQFCTVTKVHTGHDDKTLDQLQTELKMDEICSDSRKVPNWLNCNKVMIPDFVAQDPKKQPVWEITGAEFTQHDVHTADGISIRFPRVTRIRHDKTWKTATTLQELQNLFKTSKESTNFKLLMDVQDDTIEDKAPSTKKRKQNDSIEASSSKIQKTTNGNIKTVCDNDLTNKIKDPLLNIFKDIQLLLEDGAKDVFEKWSRYFVAYGGTVLESKDWEKSTHVLHLENSVKEQSIKCPKHARHIICDWIKDSINENKLQDCAPYMVVWKSQEDTKDCT